METVIETKYCIFESKDVTRTYCKRTCYKRGKGRGEANCDYRIVLWKKETVQRKHVPESLPEKIIDQKFTRISKCRECKNFNGLIGIRKDYDVCRECLKNDDND
jgi:hypothetical protein